jgi:polyisoprenoid-binding protein YceI
MSDMRSRAWLVALLVGWSLLFPRISAGATYQVDPNHSTVIFKVRHLFSTVVGRFDKFSGTITFDPNDPAKVKVEGAVEVTSINTNNAKRDDHLRSKDFFDVQQFPTLTFVTTGVPALDPSKKSGKLDGNLTIHGVTKPVVIDAFYLGEDKDPSGNVRAGFSGKTKLNRKDFGLTWNKALESGGVLVGDEIEIEIDAEGVAQK